MLGRFGASPVDDDLPVRMTYEALLSTKYLGPYVDFARSMVVGEEYDEALQLVQTVMRVQAEVGIPHALWRADLCAMGRCSTARSCASLTRT